MPQIGTIDVNLHTVDRDETVYKTDNHNVSHVDVVALRRTAPRNERVDPLRTNMRFERGFPLADETERSVVVSIAITAPPGVVVDDVKTFISLVLTQAATAAADLGVTGDIHLGA